MATVGRACLILGLAVALYGAGAALYGIRTRRREWIDSGRRSVYALAGVLTVAFAILEVAFLRSDFSFDVVASHSSTTTPTFYKAAAAWSSQEGSLLLWAWLLAVWSSIVLRFAASRVRDLIPYATAILLGLGAFFVGLTVFLADPFAVSKVIPAEGAGLNPLLRHPSMMIHPPLLYSGYTLATIPMAFAAAALLTRRLDARWIAVTRRFMLAAWLCLGVGILLGARWSYVELGWGGYWGWDPVENASLLPWLTGTALLHSVQIQEKRGMLKVWNASLVLATGILAILGTFLVRSGILDSIHAFGASTLGTPFLVLIGVLVAGAVTLVVSRRRELRSEHRLDSLLSREAMFLLNNLVLVGMAFVVFWGTFFPLISEAITGTKAAVGPPWFDRYITPLALILILLSGLGPAIAWRASSRRQLLTTFRWPAVAAGIALAASLALGASAKPLALTMFAFAGFSVGVAIQELVRGARVRRALTGASPPRAAVDLVSRNRRRYGGYTVHIGMAVLFVGVAASSAFQQAKDVRLSPGQSTTIKGYDVRYVRATAGLAQEKITLGAVLDVRRDGKPVGTFRPTRGYFPSLDPSLGPVARYFEGQATSEVALKAGLTRDLWTAVQPDIDPLLPLIRDADKRFANSGPDVQGLLIAAIADRYRRHPPAATFRVIASPLVSWIWIGAGIVVGGAMIALWPAPLRARRRATAAARARAATAPSRA
jgi:cytochrome c-type biogenesis protein CcmF